MFFMNRRDLFRTALLGATGAAFAREFPSGADATKELASPDWKPLFLDEHQNQTLIALAELVVPGAKEALVNRFLDLLMSVEIAETQKAFVAALAYFDGACMGRYRSAFLYLPPGQQIEFLNLIAYPHSHQAWGEKTEEFPGNQHFSQMKDWISGAYYSSPAGLKELGWDGGPPHGVYAGCEHQDGH